LMARPSRTGTRRIRSKLRRDIRQPFTDVKVEQLS
jgi:hypothetical protein